MKKICLTVVGMYLLYFHSFAQSSSHDSTTYEAKKLALEEVNLVSSFYTQDGNHSAVTGGIGTEKVTDLSNGLEITFAGQNTRGIKHSVNLGIGIDHHTAASSAYVSKTGASKTGGTRVYPSLNWTIDNQAHHRSLSMGMYYSTEYNYKSFGLDAAFSKRTKDNNGEFSAKATAYFDKVTLIFPSEITSANNATNPNTTYYTTASGRTVRLGGSGYDDEEEGLPTSPRNTYALSLTYSQVINQRLQASVTSDLVAQTGFLALPFHRVYFTDGSMKVENLPRSRYKLPVGIRVNYFAGDRFIFRTNYRFYVDDWGIQSHTINLEVPIKITPFFSLSPFYRYYQQTAAKYFAAYSEHKTTDEYFSSNYALSAFNSQFYGMGVRIATPGGIFHSLLNSLELRYGHYTQTTELMSDVISLALKFK